LTNLGIVASEEKNWTEAAEFFRASIQVMPQDAKSHYLLARAEFSLGQRKEAAAEIEKALQLRPGQPDFIQLAEEIRAHP
jgi:uncharacterized protein HemY